MNAESVKDSKSSPFGFVPACCFEHSAISIHRSSTISMQQIVPKTTTAESLCYLPRLFPRHRAFVLASFCRFGTTARKAASGACAAGSGGPGGSAELLRSWQRCRQARAWPRQTAEAAQNLEDWADATEWCCGDMRCMHRLLELQPTLKEAKQL